MRIIFSIIVLLAGCGANIGQTTKLTGIVYDAYGAIIVGAVVTAVDGNKAAFVAKTDETGAYELILPFRKYEPGVYHFKISVYEITATAQHFQKSIVSNFRVVPAYRGSLRLDFGLDVTPADPCHDPTACGPAMPVEKSKETIPTQKVSPRPNAGEIRKQIGNKDNY